MPVCGAGSDFGLKIPRSKLRGIFDRKEFCLFLIRSLTPPEATGLASAVAVQIRFGTVHHLKNQGNW
jgi:hypothetical protein